MGLDTAIYIVAILLVVYFMLPEIAANAMGKVGLSAYAPSAKNSVEGVYGGPNADPLNETVWGGIVASTPYSHYRDNYGNNQGRRVCV